MWTETAIDLLTDKRFLLKRYFEQVKYLADLKSKMRKKNINLGRYYELKESAEFQLNRFKKALKSLGVTEFSKGLK